MIPIEDFNPNAIRLKEIVYTGPQEEVLCLVDEINNYFNVDIGVSKTFRVKAGSYDRVKQYIHEQMGFHTKGGGFEAIIKRVQSNHFGWLENKFRLLDAAIRNAKASASCFQDNEEEVILSIEEIRNRLSGIEYPNPNINYRCNVLTDADEVFNLMGDRYRSSFESDYDFSHPNNWIVEIKLEYVNGTMRVYNNNKDNFIQELPIAPVHSKFLISYGRLLTHFATPENRSSNNSNFRKAFLNNRYVVMFGQDFSFRNKYLSDHHRINHPFINSHTRESYHEDRWMGGCSGDQTNAFSTATSNLDINRLIYFWSEWMSTYIINVTNPLNNISKMYEGSPSCLTEAYKNIIGVSSPNNCNYSLDIQDFLIENTDYCNKIECTYRNICSSYLMLNSPDYNYQLEQMYFEVLDYFGEPWGDAGFKEINHAGIMRAFEEVKCLEANSDYNQLFDELLELCDINIEKHKALVNSYRLKFCSSFNADIYHIDDTMRCLSQGIDRQKRLLDKSSKKLVDEAKRQMSEEEIIEMLMRNGQNIIPLTGNTPDNRILTNIEEVEVSF